jgi:hypothetical protein
MNTDYDLIVNGPQGDDNELGACTSAGTLEKHYEQLRAFLLVCCSSTV